MADENPKASPKVVPIDPKDSVKRDIVVEVLRRHGNTVLYDGEDVVVIKGQVARVYKMLDRVDNRMLQHLKRTFDIPIHPCRNPDSPPALLSSRAVHTADYSGFPDADSVLIFWIVSDYTKGHCVIFRLKKISHFPHSAFSASLGAIARQREPDEGSLLRPQNRHSTAVRHLPVGVDWRKDGLLSGPSISVDVQVRCSFSAFQILLHCVSRLDRSAFNEAN